MKYTLRRFVHETPGVRAPASDLILHHAFREPWDRCEAIGMKYIPPRFVDARAETIAERRPASDLTLHPRHPQTVEQLRGALA